VAPTSAGHHAPVTWDVGIDWFDDEPATAERLVDVQELLSEYSARPVERAGEVDGRPLLRVVLEMPQHTLKAALIVAMSAVEGATGAAVVGARISATAEDLGSGR
jgi:hypothetical protein